jgi:hypothetical protein
LTLLAMIAIGRSIDAGSEGPRLLNLHLGRVMKAVPE